MGMERLTVYGSAYTRALRTLWMILELNVDYRHVPVGPSDRGELASAQFLALNPNARVPVIEHGEFVLWESLAINLYLARKYPSAGLAPATLEQEALAWQWTLWANSVLDEPVITVARHRLLLSKAERDEQLADSTWNALKKPFAVLEGALCRQPFLLGSAFTVADLNVASVMYRCLYLDMDEWPRVGLWLQQCFSRPAARAALEMRELKVPS